MVTVPKYNRLIVSKCQVLGPEAAQSSCLTSGQCLLLGLQAQHRAGVGSQGPSVLDKPPFLQRVPKLFRGLC